VLDRERSHKTIGPLAVRISRIRGRQHSGDLHKVVPESRAAKHSGQRPASRNGFTRNGHSLPAAAQHNLHASAGFEAACGIGIRERREDLAKPGAVRFPAGPTEPRSAADQRPAEQDFAEPLLVFTRDAQDVFDEIADG
jgi:hypothetical protein